ncbi:metal-dependent hydrolase [Sulfitobacter sp. D35]|uniref:metal-dependent hydrolase n=1 Tax=Sulfitobacter sp. D35 TaxID=3083252 RepID=UPI00296F4CC4|nr:metal-dependent hydrolase [Sulfitobacter sp. D35]MDW4499844.1 metal-dependent hydrolase [Sulfitobacter sp. D35]
MKIIWLGHGSFRIEIEDQVLLIDPWLSGNPMLPEDRHAEAIEGATNILLTHGHFDHASDIVKISKRTDAPVSGMVELMTHFGESEGLETTGFNIGGTIKLGGVAVSMVPAMHSNSLPDGSAPAGRETGFVIRGEGHTIYLSGDTGLMADMDWIGDYYRPDIGILSAGGHFTMDMAQAAYAAKKYFSFETLIPCHYKTFPLLEQSAADLLEALPGVRVIEPEVMIAIEV